MDEDGVLDELLFMLEAVNFPNNLILQLYKTKGIIPNLKVPSHEPSMSSKSTMEDVLVLDALLFMLACRHLAHMMIIRYQN